MILIRVQFNNSESIIDADSKLISENAVQWYDCKYFGGSYSSGLTFNNVVFE